MAEGVATGQAGVHFFQNTATDEDTGRLINLSAMVLTDGVFRAATAAKIAPGGISKVLDLEPLWFTEAKSAKEGIVVYRVFGGDAQPAGFSWTIKDPRTVSNFRDVAGLPSGGGRATNTARFMVEGVVNPEDVIKIRSALALDGNKGGLPELIIDPNKVKVKGVSSFEH